MKSKITYALSLIYQVYYTCCTCNDQFDDVSNTVQPVCSVSDQMNFCLYSFVQILTQILNEFSFEFRIIYYLCTILTLISVLRFRFINQRFSTIQCGGLRLKPICVFVAGFNLTKFESNLPYSPHSSILSPTEEANYYDTHTHFNLKLPSQRIIRYLINTFFLLQLPPTAYLKVFGQMTHFK